MVIINADDFGMSEEVNEGIALLFKKGLIQRTTLMMNMPFTDHAIKISKEFGFFDKVGLHVNLTEGTPMSSLIKTTKFCKHNNMSRHNFKLFSQLFVTPKQRKALEEEIQFQINAFLCNKLPLKHMDSHNYTNAHFSLVKSYIKKCKENGFYSIRVAKNVKSKRNRGLKLLYRKICNIKLKRFCLNNINENTCLFFASPFDYLNALQTIDSSTNVEILVHPVFMDGKIMDHYSGVELETLCKQLLKMG